MIIQFNIPKDKVKESVITYLMNKLINFKNSNKELLRAEVNLKTESTGEKHCDISLTIPGDSFFASQTADSFEEAAVHAINAIELRICESAKDEKFPLLGKFHCRRITLGMKVNADGLIE